MTFILGIDPGLTHTGWGVIKVENNKLIYVACGTISSSAKTNIEQRLGDIYTGINSAIKLYNPHECAIERTFVNNNPLSSLKLGHARGAAMLTVALASIPVTEYSPTEVKKAVTGVGGADKNQIDVMIKYLLPTAKIKSKDEADALAIAVCHSSYRRGK
ncbi:MAG: crossover junction endodeoxyribonuclease RuvC [Alphaproteobacteria bacterium]